MQRVEKINSIVQGLKQNEREYLKMSIIKRIENI